MPGTLPGAGNGRRLASNRARRRSPAPRASRIDTPALAGSIALKGGRIDDVSLKNYHETVDDKSPRIVLLSPTGTANPYYAEFGWVGQNAGPLPTGDTVWTADATTLSPGKPRDAELRQRRRPGVQAHHRGRRQVHVHRPRRGREQGRRTRSRLYPYSLVSRWGKPHTQGYYVLHEGMIGVLGADGLQEYTYDHLAKEPALGNASTKGKTWTGVTGGFVGITDKYWAAAAIPDQATPYTGSLHRAHRRRHQGLPGQRARRRAA